MKVRILGLAIIASALSVTGAVAHHSFAMFDNTKPMTIEGTVSEFQWTSPHTFIHVQVQDPKTQKMVQWEIEGAPPSSLRRRGWNRDSIKVGDKARIVLFPVRSGAPFGGLDSVLINGKPVGGAMPE